MVRFVGRGCGDKAREWGWKLGPAVLRRKHPDLPRPYRVWGYTYVPALFLAASLLLAVNTVFERPLESLLGLGLLAAGLPAYAFWHRRAAIAPA